MLFCYYGTHFAVRKRIFLSDLYIGYGGLGTFKVNNMLSPNTPSSIDNSKYSSYKKLHQEYLERTRIAHNYSYEEVSVINIIDNSINRHYRYTQNYGYNETYGFLDTTGTASGLRGNVLKEKALLELLEKNDLLVMWYKMHGRKIIQCDIVRRLIDTIGLHSDEIFIFACSHTSNLLSFSVLLFNNKKIIASGISCNKDSMEALKSALLEAKLLESLNRDPRINPFSHYSEDQYEELYQYVKALDSTLQPTHFIESKKENIVLNKWIKNIESVVLNTKSYHKWITIRYLSKDLINSIPIKSRLIKCTNKKIFQVYNITKNDIDTKPECVIF